VSQVAQNAGKYYNDTPGSGVVDPVTNSPRPFAQRDVMDLHGVYPLWMDASLVGTRAQVRPPAHYALRSKESACLVDTLLVHVSSFTLFWALHSTRVGSTRWF
jgi:hypothetical protein